MNKNNYIVIQIFQDIPLEPNQIEIINFDTYKSAFNYISNKVYRLLSYIDEDGNRFGPEDIEYIPIINQLSDVGYINISDIYFEIRK